MADKSGHKSVQGLRCYERILLKQDQVAGKLINDINKPVVDKEFKSDSDTMAHSTQENGYKSGIDPAAGHAQIFIGTLPNFPL